jgi:hypothetical protein
MYIIYLEDGTKHSAWRSNSEAVKQIEVLENHGYRDVWYDYIEGLNLENGHYFV